METVAVEIEAAPDAAACGAMGCRETEELVRVETPDGARVLCVEHAQGWLQ